ncbi:restriction endonuclease subunit S [Limosilactobacillus reuteri]|uniref:Type I restriction modification DNA specificity domain-containing protein n=1 Tax=Limosilactobacillus reuteri TaxID=1598 RepID=A0ABD6Y643_LIMRT|nr:restriction endonuclease subunit S [Limosilactobacillus reuteri]PWT37172.1 hypothetical protein DKZ35_06560 [Limosilactobacillus reuteri]
MKYKISELVSINSKAIKKDYDGLIKYIDTSSVNNGKFDNPRTYSTLHDAPSRARRMASVGDTVISTVRPNMKHIGFISENNNYVYSTGFAVVSPNRKLVDPYYLYLYLSSAFVTKTLQSIGETSTSTYPSIKPNDIGNLSVDIPSMKEQTVVAKRIRLLDEKIKFNNRINDNLLKQLKLSFNNLYLSLTDDKTFTLGELIFENISGDWGKAQSQGDFTNRVTIIRGADIDDLALGNSAKTPIRYIKNRALVNKHLLPNDVLVEISGGSPTQSTGRSLLVSDSVIDKFSSEVLGTNFTRIFRPSSEENSILFKSYLDFLYDKDVFFNYENGTTGIKNLDYKSVLKIQLPDIRKANNYQQYINLYKLYNNTVQSNGRQSVQLTKIRQAMLNNFF